MRISKSLIGVGIVVVSGFVIPGAANAALSDCDANHMCMWGNNDFLWKIGERTHGSDSLENLAGEYNDQMDSWANRSATYTGCMFGSAGGAGDRQVMAKVSSDNNVSPLNSDEVSSWRTKNGC